MTAINPYFSSSADFRSLDSDVDGSRASRSSRLAVSTEQSTDLSLTTAEGDKVTLSYGEASSAAYSSYEGMMQNGNRFAAASAQSLTLSNGSSFSLSVQGDLSEQELEDIYSLVGDIDGVMGKMLDGDMEGALDAAMGVGAYGSIAGFEANLQFQQQIYSEQSYMVETTGRGAGGLPGSGAGSGTIDTGLFDKIMAEMDDSISGSGVEPAKLERSLEDYFAQIKETLLENRPEEDSEGDSKVRLADRVRTGLLDKLRSLADRLNPAEEPGVIPPGNTEEIEKLA